MKFLHSSDWHLGIKLYGRTRYEEQEAFLSWLIDTVNTHEIELLLVSGDIFDSSMPANKAQELYYGFLGRLAKTTCKHAVIIAGNHDSASLLGAPAELLKMMDIHVVGQIGEQPEDSLIHLRDKAGKLQAIVCAVPYLRERELRQVEAGESLSDKEEKLQQGIKRRYQDVIEAAYNDKEYSPEIPIVVMGHLYMQESYLNESNAVRELYLGSIIRSSVDIFAERLSYVALGHLHRCQKVGGKDQIRYSGSPIPLSFAEAEYPHKVLIGHLGEAADIQALEVPQSYIMKSIAGDEEQIVAVMKELIEQDQICLIEIEYRGTGSGSLLRDEVNELLKGSRVELLRFQNRQYVETTLRMNEDYADLATLDPKQVFEKRLEKMASDEPEFDEAEIKALWACYHQILQELQESDSDAE